jgi:hypothetical protein
MLETESVAEKSARVTGSGPGRSARASGLSWSMTMRVRASAMPTSG